MADCALWSIVHLRFVAHRTSAYRMPYRDDDCREAEMCFFLRVVDHFSLLSTCATVVLAMWMPTGSIVDPTDCDERQRAERGIDEVGDG